MTQHYLNPKDAGDPYLLPNVETFYVGYGIAWNAAVNCFVCSAQNEIPAAVEVGDLTPHSEHVGWYWWLCFPGCLPDSEPYGPFVTEEEALADTREICFTERS